MTLWCWVLFYSGKFPLKLVCSSRFHLIKCLQLDVFQILNDFNYIHNQIDNESNYTGDITGSEAIKDPYTKMYCLSVGMDLSAFQPVVTSHLATPTNRK